MLNELKNLPKPPSLVDVVALQVLYYYNFHVTLRVGTPLLRRWGLGRVIGGD